MEGGEGGSRERTGRGRERGGKKGTWVKMSRAESVIRLRTEAALPSLQMHHINAENQKLALLCHAGDKEKFSMFRQLEDMKDKIKAAARENMRLQGEVAAVRKALEVMRMFLVPLFFFLPRRLPQRLHKARGLAVQFATELSYT